MRLLLMPRLAKPLVGSSSRIICFAVHALLRCNLLGLMQVNVGCRQVEHVDLLQCNGLSNQAILSRNGWFTGTARAGSENGKRVWGRSRLLGGDVGSERSGPDAETAVGVSDGRRGTPACTADRIQ